MRRLLNQAANAAVKVKGSVFEIVFRRLLPRLGFKQAIGAIAHRLSRLIWKILHQGVRYEERGPGGQPKVPSSTHNKDNQRIEKSRISRRTGTNLSVIGPFSTLVPYHHADHGDGAVCQGAEVGVEKRKEMSKMLESTEHYLWHGNVGRARNKIEDMLGFLDELEEGGMGGENVPKLQKALGDWKTM